MGHTCAGSLRAQGSPNSKQSQKPSVQAQQEAPGEQQQNPASSPVPRNPEGTALNEPPPGPPPVNVLSPSYRDQYINQADNQQQSSEQDLLERPVGRSEPGRRREWIWNSGWASSPRRNRGDNHVSPDGIAPPLCQQQSQQRNSTRMQIHLCESFALRISEIQL